MPERNEQNTSGRKREEKSGNVLKRNGNKAGVRKRRAGTLSRRTYILSSLALIILVTAAFMMPQAVMLLQDGKNRDVIHLGTRSELKYAAADIEYEMDEYNRMKGFAQGCAQGRQYFIASSDYTGSENDNELREKALLGQEWYWYLIEMGYADNSVKDYKDYYEGVNILKKEYLVIYDNDPENGASFVCWYLQFELDNNVKINLLMDAKDNSIYYIDIQCDISDNSIISTFNNNNIYDYIFSYFLFYFPSDNIVDGTITESMETANQSTDFIALTDTGVEKKLNYGDNSLTLHINCIKDRSGNMLGFQMGIQEIMDLLPADKKAVQ